MLSFCHNNLVYIERKKPSEQSGLDGLIPVPTAPIEPIPSLGSNILEFIQSTVVFMAIISIIYLFAVQPHKVSGCSMCDTFENGDYILTDKVTYHFSKPQHGDIVVFKYPRDPSIDFIKRIIAVPGDKIKLSNTKVILNGTTLDESYIENKPTYPNDFLRENQEFTVPEDSYIVFGDNRTGSSDSRAWGELPKDLIIGKAMFRYWPPTMAGFIKNPDQK